MKKRILISLFVTISLTIVGYYSYRINQNDVKVEKQALNTNNYIEKIEDIKINISGNEYIVDVEDSETVKAFISMLPREFKMKESNNNQKYVYLGEELPKKEVQVKELKVGDIVLDKDDCLIIFYKPVKTSRSYTRIGHIENLPSLGNTDTYIRFYK